MVKFDKYDYKDWHTFRIHKKTTITGAEFKMVCELHAKYYKHKFNKICTCNPKKINRWIKELNVIFNNGN